jgi:hypothetical protein
MLVVGEPWKTNDSDIPWLRVEAILRPLVKASIANPVHSCSHERCVIQYAESLLKQGKEREVQDMMKTLHEACQATGRQFRSVESNALLKAQDGPGNVSLKNDYRDAHQIL